jgi:hypothetical protein
LPSGHTCYQIAKYKASHFAETHLIFITKLRHCVSDIKRPPNGGAEQFNGKRFGGQEGIEMKIKRTASIPLAAAAAAAFAFAPFSVLTSGVAQAGPLCPASLAQNPALYQQCLTAEQNQNYCGLASGCTPGDPCVVGSPIERSTCQDARAAGQQPHY